MFEPRPPHLLIVTLEKKNIYYTNTSVNTSNTIIWGQCNYDCFIKWKLLIRKRALNWSSKDIHIVFFYKYSTFIFLFLKKKEKMHHDFHNNIK